MMLRHFGENFLALVSLNHPNMPTCKSDEPGSKDYMYLYYMSVCLSV